MHPKLALVSTASHGHCLESWYLARLLEPVWLQLGESGMKHVSGETKAIAGLAFWSVFGRPCHERQT